VPVSRNHYKVLQVDPEADPDVIEAVYRRLARKYHPDVLPGGTDERMKELNAAYAVLRDPARRASYDRQLADAGRREAEQQATRWAQSASWEAQRPPEPEPQYRAQPGQESTYRAQARTERQYRSEPQYQAEWARCGRHPGVVAATSCADCGTGLCAYCSTLFQPPTCTLCLLRWAGRRRLRLVLPPLILPALLLIGYLFWEVVLRELAGLAVSGWLLLALAYWTGSFYFGVRAARELSPDSDSLVAGFIACFLGPFAAPVMIGRSLIEYRQLQRLVAIARTS
jgi:DnaJ domain